MVQGRSHKNRELWIIGFCRLMLFRCEPELDRLIWVYSFSRLTKACGPDAVQQVFASAMRLNLESENANY